MSEPITALEELCRRGGVQLVASDMALLRHPFAGNSIVFAGGVREEADGSWTFIGAIECAELQLHTKQRANELITSSFHGFFDAAADGLPLTDMKEVVKELGAPVQQAYSSAGIEFQRFATSYWTLNVLVHNAFSNPSPLAVMLLRRISEEVGDLFFPDRNFDWIDPAKREADQRKLIRAFAPRIPVEDFMLGSPIVISRSNRSSHRKWWRKS